MEIMSPKKKKKKKTTTTTYVPNDIIIDIFSWVPANSLIRLRWACKYWFHLITRDTSFAKLHLHCSTTIHHPHNLSVLISKRLKLFTGYYWPLKPCKIFQYYIDNSTTPTGPSFSGRATNPILSGIFVDFQILGSCHGLILFSYYLRQGNEIILCIWNPCTKEYKYLPKPPYGFDGEEIFEVYTNFGLGYDQRIQDYKVICNVKYWDGHIQVQVYTLRANSWKLIESISTNWDAVFVGFIGNGVFVNVDLHFIYDEGKSYPGARRRILSLDFEKEMYVKISNLPVCLNDNAKSIQGLTIFEGSFCLTMRTGNSIEAWVMKKDYNMNNNQEEYSWSKLCEIPEHYGLLHDFLQPLRFTKEGEILLLDSREGLVLFDPKNNKITVNEDYMLHPIKQATTVDPHPIKQATTVDRHNTSNIYREPCISKLGYLY